MGVIMMNLKKKVLLLMDNAPSNKPPKLSDIEVVMLPPNTTSKLQPLDAGVIQSFKEHYR